MTLDTGVPAQAPRPRISHVAQSVLALRAWHRLSNDDVAAAMNASLATLDRRLKRGDWRFEEVRALSGYFGVSIEALETGRINLPESVLTIGYGCNRWVRRRNEPIPSQRIAA